MPILQGASGVTISGGTMHDVTGDLTINNSGSQTTNHDSYNTRNETYHNTNKDYSRNDFRAHQTTNLYRGPVQNFGSAKNINAGTNYGGMGNEDNRGSNPPWVHDGYAQRDHGYQQGGNRPPIPHPYSDPAPGSYWQEAPQYYRHPPYQPPSAAYPPRGYPPGSPPYQDRSYYPPHGSQYPVDPRYAQIPTAGMEDPRMREGYYGGPYEGAGYTPHGPVPLAAGGLTPASHPQARSDITASAPPSMASSSNGSAEGATPPMKSDKGPADPSPKDKDRS